jgi:hypothetical protein
MTSLSDQTSVLMDLQSGTPTSFNTKSAYEAGLVQNAPDMNKSNVLGYAQDRTFASMFPPVCIKNHWDSEALSKFVLPSGAAIPLPVDPRPLVKNCTQYFTSTPPNTSDAADALTRSKIDIDSMPRMAIMPFEIYSQKINSESDLLLNHPQDKCDDNKWAAEPDSDLYVNRHAPPRESKNTFSELSRPLATIVPMGPYKCRAEADERAWERSARVFNNVTRSDRIPGGLVSHSEAPLTKRGSPMGKPTQNPRVWPSRSVVFYVGYGDGGHALTKLALALRARDYEVTIFSPLRTATYEGLSYHNLTVYIPNDVYSAIIMWGDSELLGNYKVRPNCKALLYHVEHNEDNDVVCHGTIRASVDKIIVKSAYHRSLYSCYSWSKFEIIPDGLPVHLYTDMENRNLSRERYRVLVTEYTMDLIPFIKYGWPRLRAAFPAAELHIWSTVGDMKAKVMPLLMPTAKGKGIVVHDGGDRNTMVRERFRSSVHICLEDYDQISAESVRMSALAGCIPIMPNRGVYSELRGVTIDGSVKEEATILTYVKECAKIFNDNDYAVKERKLLQSDESLRGWNGTAEQWLLIIRNLAETTKPFSINAYRSLFPLGQTLSEKRGAPL